MTEPHRRLWIANFVPAVALVLFFFLSATPSYSDRSSIQGAGFSMELPNSEADVVAAVQTVVDDHIIRGTYIYEREKVLNDAVAEKSSTFFGSSKNEDHVFYKVRRDALAPRNFKDSSDIGVITVRYIVRTTSDAMTHLEITAVFVEDGTKRVHPSNSSVETSEFAEIQKQLLSIQKDRQMAAEVNARKSRETVAAAALAKQRAEEIAQTQVADTSLKSLEQRAADLQRALEVHIPNPNTELKAAPFRGAATLARIPADTDVLVEIVTTYWLGIETPDGHRGWVQRDQVTPLP